ncbi:hypothetical protein [Roseicyclus sp.]|uniref:hypothetical protein n=1 Tax=Roseicyclus sp. TaxID=1914329 RepID=UPI003F6AC3A0
MLRMILPILTILAPLPATAWEAGRAGALCTLSDATGDVVLTHDPNGPVYTITARRSDPWPEAAIFGITFLGQDGLTITTDRHIRSEDGRAITVTDQGFGNLLAGMRGNDTATLFAGPVSKTVSLAGAAPAVAAFEDCTPLPLS